MSGVEGVGSDEVIRVENVSRRFRIDGREIVVLDGISLTARRGELIGIVGSSGAGKSTFLHVVGAIDRPSSGRVLYGGVDIFSLGERRLAAFRSENIGFVFQASHLLPEFSAEENVALAAMIAGVNRRDAARSARDLLAQVGLGERLTHRPGKLSGGEQQRVAIARALINKPDIVLADEPTGNLDTSTGEDVFSLIMRMNRELGQTFLIVTHNMDLAKKMTRVVRIRDGKFVDQDSDMLQ